MGDHYKASQFIAAIPGSAGIISIIARRVGCDWNTAKKYVTPVTIRKDLNALGRIGLPLICVTETRWRLVKEGE